jgi:DNA-binding PadR family transcriptional regulator
MWVLIALDGDPLALPALFDAIRTLDGPIGPGTLVAALSRLEVMGLVESTVYDSRQRVYRLTILGRAGSRSAAILEGRPA